MKSSSRRDFLKTAAVATAGPLVLPSGLMSAETSANGRLRMGFIGMGKQNGGLMGNFLSQEGVEVVAVCEVDQTRREHAAKQANEAHAKAGRKVEVAATDDYRELTQRDDIDAVCIATPDHWHTVITVDALRNGKDVYCEKPLTHNIHESKVVIDETAKNKRVLQTGSMQRSMSEFRVAAELVRNGVIGDIKEVICSFGDPGIPCDLPEEEMEPGLNWDLWLGPAEVRPYNSTLSPRGVHDHFPNWRSYREFGGGMVTDWGAHHLDIAQWGLGMDESGPVEALPPEGWEPLKSKRGARLIYANGVPVIHGESPGVRFVGTEGEVIVNRGRFALKKGGKFVAKFLGEEDRQVSLGSQVAKAEKEFLADAKVKLYESNHQISDFLGAVRKRSTPICPAEVGGRTAICCHLMNLAYYHGKPIKWEPKAMEFAGGTGDPAWLTRDYRAPWSV